MLKAKYIIIFLIVCLIAYTTTNKHIMITEFLANPPPTLSSLETDLEDTKKKVEKLSKEVIDMKQQGQAGAAQASLAKSSLAAAKNS
jgi:hypothetical protein